MKPNAGSPFGHPGSFGAPGVRGSFGLADPEAQIGYGYVMNRMGSSSLVLFIGWLSPFEVSGVMPTMEGSEVLGNYCGVLTI